MQQLKIIKLTPSDRHTARKMFSMMAKVFGEDYRRLPNRYVDRLLRDDRFWALAALIGNDVVGGVTAHVLSMTKAESCELFIYDVAVARPHQRRGIGRQLVSALLEFAADTDIEDVFVAADNDDANALDFYRSAGGKASPVTLFLFSLPRRSSPRIVKSHTSDVASNSG